MRNRQYYKQAISNEDYSFTAQSDGKYTYCFSNEGWTSNSKEVSFNVHGIVYVSESEMSQDPLEAEGTRARAGEKLDGGVHPSVIQEHTWADNLRK